LIEQRALEPKSFVFHFNNFLTFHIILYKRREMENRFWLQFDQTKNSISHPNIPLMILITHGEGELVEIACRV
jgi:hypothetical protein